MGERKLWFMSLDELLSHYDNGSITREQLLSHLVERHEQSNISNRDIVEDEKELPKTKFRFTN